MVSQPYPTPASLRDWELSFSVKPHLGKGWRFSVFLASEQ